MTFEKDGWGGYTMILTLALVAVLLSEVWTVGELVMLAMFLLAWESLGEFIDGYREVPE